MRTKLKFIIGFIVFTLFLGLSFSLYASSKLIKELEFSGNARTSTETIQSKIYTRKGTYFDKELIKLDIKSLYELGSFEDISVDIKNLGSGVKLTYLFIEKPIIGAIDFEGNKKVKSDDLREEITVNTFSTLNEKELAESMEKIRQAYAKKRYYLAEVSYHLEDTEPGEAKLVFDINENKGVIVRRIDFIGNKVFTDDDLRHAISIRKKNFFSFLTGSGKFNEEQLNNDSMMLTFHYLNHGYLKVKVQPANVSISKDKRYLFVYFQITEGKQYKIGDLKISGDILTTNQEMLSLIKTESGKIYSQQILEEDIRNLSDAYGDEGYAYANIVPITIPNDETLTADIDLRIDKGKRINIERINIFGNTVTRDKVIRREILLKENDRYSERLLRESRKRLIQLGYFEEVNFATPRGTSDDKIIINVTVKERPTGSFNIGAGFSTVEQFILNASLKKDNFFGYGVSAGFGAELSKKRQMFSLSGKDPYFLDTNLILGAELYRNAYYYSDFRRVAMGGGLTLGRRFFDYWSAEVGYKAEDIEISDFSYAVPQLFRDNASGLTSALSLSLTYNRLDNRLVPRSGIYGAAVNEVSGTKLGGDNDFYRTNLRFMAYEGVINKKVVFKQYGRVGYIKSLNNDAVPLFERFFLGGPYSLRGFYPNSVGPTLRIPTSPFGPETEFVYGGDKLLLFVSELEWWIYEPGGLSVVAFFDAGNSFAEQENYSITNLRMDYGFGFRWNSPMGPLRFEWGLPINKRSGEDSVVFNFTIGNLF